MTVSKKKNETIPKSKLRSAMIWLPSVDQCEPRSFGDLYLVTGPSIALVSVKESPCCLFNPGRFSLSVQVKRGVKLYFHSFHDI